MFTNIVVGDQSGEGRPVPIPNTEVNLSSDMPSTEHKLTHFVRLAVFGKGRTLPTIFF